MIHLLHVMHVFLDKWGLAEYNMGITVDCNSKRTFEVLNARLHISCNCRCTIVVVNARTGFI